MAQGVEEQPLHPAVPALPARAAMQCADVCSAVGHGRLVGCSRGRSCSPTPRRACSDFERRLRALAVRSRLPQRAASARPRAWGLLMEEQEAERENELTAFGLCAGGVISNVLEAAVFEEGEEFDLETSSDLDDSDAEEEHSPVSVMESKIEAVSKSWESKQQQELSSGCATPSLVDSDDDYEEVLSLVSDDAFDEDCNGERAMLYVQAALSVAKGATDGALADAFGFEEEEARIQQEENIQLDHLILKNTGELASTDAEELASTYQSTDQEAFTEEAREETEEEESSEPLDGDDGEVSTVAPSECDIQEVFQESAVEDIAFDCVSGLLDSGIDGLMTRIMPGDALTEVDAAELATVEAPFAPDVAASQPDFVAMNSVPEAPHVLASVPEPMVLTETPGDAPEPELRAAAVEPVPTAVAQAAAVTQAIEAADVASAQASTSTSKAAVPKAPEAAAVTQAIEAADVASAQLSEFTSKAAVPKAEPRPQEQPQPRAAQPSPPSEEASGPAPAALGGGRAEAAGAAAAPSGPAPAALGGGLVHDPRGAPARGCGAAPRAGSPGQAQPHGGASTIPAVKAHHDQGGGAAAARRRQADGAARGACSTSCSTCASSPFTAGHGSATPSVGAGATDCQDPGARRHHEARDGQGGDEPEQGDEQHARPLVRRPGGGAQPLLAGYDLAYRKLDERLKVEAPHHRWRRQGTDRRGQGAYPERQHLQEGHDGRP
uniref:PpiC domain-containing protein n=1 Tax=Alexandrium monilatum TaxID=311494 RepID=A0A7S4R741_9DINO